METAFFRVLTKAGYLAIMPRPRLEPGYPESIATLSAVGIGRVVSLLEPAESSMLGLDDEARTVVANGMQFASFPISDFGLPSSVKETASLCAEMYQQLTAGTNILLHCRAGVGRSGLMAAAIMLQGGFDPEQAFKQISNLRGASVPETAEQREWLIMNYEIIIANQ